MTSFFWLAPDPEGNQTAFLATTTEALNQVPCAEYLDDLLSGAYESELFYLSADDGFAKIDTKTCELNISNHDQTLFALKTDSLWASHVKQAECFIWVVGLSEHSEEFQQLPKLPAEKLLQMMHDDLLITLIVIAAPNDSGS